MQKEDVPHHSTMVFHQFPFSNTRKFMVFDSMWDQTNISITKASEESKTVETRLMISFCSKDITPHQN
jgi:hypothetical protein